MIKSMTGFASLTRDDERGAIGVTIRSVNHRFLDLQARLPAAIADLEPRIRAIVQKQLARGRVEVSVSLQLRQGTAPQVELNADFAQALAARLIVVLPLTVSVQAVCLSASRNRVLRSPAMNFGCEMMRCWRGRVVWIPSTTNMSNARSIRRIASSRLSPCTMSFATSES